MLIELHKYGFALVGFFFIFFGATNYSVYHADEAMVGGTNMTLKIGLDFPIIWSAGLQAHAALLICG